MGQSIRLFLAILSLYRSASLLSSEEGPYLPFLYKDAKQTGVFKWIRMRLGAFEYGPDGLPLSNLGRGISCSLCTGVYISALLTFLVFKPTRFGDVLLTWLGMSGFQVYLENQTDDAAIQEAIEDVADSLEE